MKKPKRAQSKLKWVLAAVAAAVLSAPANAMNWLSTQELDAFTASALRFALASLIMLPLVIPILKKHRKVILKHLPRMLVISAVLGAMMPLFFMVVELSSASFVTVMELFGPIIFVVLSTIIMRDKITKAVIVGLLLAILGGTAIVILPMVTGGESMNFGWLPLVIMVVSLILDAFILIYFRSTHKKGVPLLAVIFIAFVITAIDSLVLAVMFHGADTFAAVPSVRLEVWLALLYNAAISTVLVRYLNTMSYEHVGAAVKTTAGYIYYIFALAIPVLLLGEAVSWELYVGAALIVLGIIVAQLRSRRKYARGFHHRAHL